MKPNGFGYALQVGWRAFRFSGLLLPRPLVVTKALVKPMRPQVRVGDDDTHPSLSEPVRNLFSQSQKSRTKPLPAKLRAYGQHVDVPVRVRRQTSIASSPCLLRKGLLSRCIDRKSSQFLYVIVNSSSRGENIPRNSLFRAPDNSRG